MTRKTDCDIAILGGGLAGGLIALALKRHRPELSVQLVEEGETLGGNHIWCFFGSDLGPEGRALVDPLVVHSWPGYEVRFPAHRRMLDTPYHAVRSERLDEVLRAELPGEAVRTGTRAIGASPDAVVLQSGERIEADGVIDCRGSGDLAELSLGWQKFAGIELQLSEPHALERPIVMDATVEQLDGYRFVYVLPTGPDRVFVEDTYYSEVPAMNASRLEERARAYAEGQGWQVSGTLHREKGVLPVARLGGRFGAYWRSGGKAAKAGVRAALFHPTTGYSLPDAVRTALLVARQQDLSGEALRGMLLVHAAERWRRGRFYRMLDTMMFDAAEPNRRYRVLERFYTLGPELIERFYAGESRFADKLRLVAGKPPVPLGRAVRALWEARKA